MGPPELVSFSVFSRDFPYFSVFSVTFSPHPVVLFQQKCEKVSFCSLPSEKHYRVRGKWTAFLVFSLFSSCFPLFSSLIQAAPLITLAGSGQKVTFEHGRQLLTEPGQSDEWGRLILMLWMSFSREKLIRII